MATSVAPAVTSFASVVMRKHLFPITIATAVLGILLFPKMTSALVSGKSVFPNTTGAEVLGNCYFPNMVVAVVLGILIFLNRIVLFVFGKCLFPDTHLAPLAPFAACFRVSTRKDAAFGPNETAGMVVAIHVRTNTVSAQAFRA